MPRRARPDRLLIQGESGTGKEPLPAPSMTTAGNDAADITDTCIRPHVLRRGGRCWRCRTVRRTGSEYPEHHIASGGTHSLWFHVASFCKQDAVIASLLCASNVARGTLIFGQSGVVEGHAQEIIQPAAQIRHRLTDMDQFHCPVPIA